MSRTIKTWLIVRATGDVRVTKRSVPLRADEIGFPVIVTIPDGWAKWYTDQAIELSMAPPTVKATAKVERGAKK